MLKLKWTQATKLLGIFAHGLARMKVKGLGSRKRLGSRLRD